jgi:hypothetical protein
MKNYIITNPEDENNNEKLDFIGGTSSKYDCIYYAKMHTKKTEPPYFTLKYKVGDEYLELENPVPVLAIKGKLLKIEFGSYTWESEEIRTVTFTLESESEKYLIILSCSFTAVLRSIINSMLGYKRKIDFLQLELYRNKSTGYNGIKCFLNGGTEPTKWFYDMTKLNTYYDRVTVNKKEVVDDSRLNEFLEVELRKHLEVICPQCEVTKIVEETVDKTDKMKEPTEEFIYGINDEQPVTIGQALKATQVQKTSVEEVSKHFEVDDTDNPKDYAQQLEDPKFFK